MKKFLLAPALAALAMFVFGAIFWMSPLPYQTHGRVADDAAAGEALAKVFPATGVYFVPGMYLESAKHEELAKRGPIAEVQFVKSGLPLMDPALLVKGYLHEFAICLLLALMLSKLDPAFHCWSRRVKFCAEIGLVVALYDFGAAIWWHHALGFVAIQAVYDFLAFVVAGAVLGKLLTPKIAPPAPAA